MISSPQSFNKFNMRSPSQPNLKHKPIQSLFTKITHFLSFQSPKNLQQPKTLSRLNSQPSLQNPQQSQKLHFLSNKKIISANSPRSFLKEFELDQKHKYPENSIYQQKPYQNYCNNEVLNQYNLYHQKDQFEIMREQQKIIQQKKNEVQSQQIYSKKYIPSNKIYFSNQSFKNKIYNHVFAKRIQIDQVRENVIGMSTHYQSYFLFDLQSVYLDHTATNRPYKTIQLIIDHVKQTIANPHNHYSHYGKFSTDLMHYSQKSLLKSFDANQQNYSAISTGNGSTGSIEKTINILKAIQQVDCIQPTVFITSYEHHSNILPWIEFYKDLRVLPYDQHGNINLQEAKRILKSCKSKKIIVSISAASNVTSQYTPLFEMNTMIGNLRKQGKNIIFGIDCAAYCCHHRLNLKLLNQVDFAYLSPHKNLGGSQSCGILVFKKKAFQLSKPTFPGGGTVDFVKGYKKEDVIYSQEIFERQIAGTPPFLGFYRAALSFELLQAIGYSVIHERQTKNTKRFLEGIQKINKKLKNENAQVQIKIYGDQDFDKRANVITLNFKLNDGQLIQHQLANLILTDVFGIQLRSGCFCAGPYGSMLLKYSSQKMKQIVNEISKGKKIKKPGFLRLDLTFYLEQYEVDYIVSSLQSTALYWRNLQKFYQVKGNEKITRIGYIQQNQCISFNKLAQQSSILSPQQYFGKRKRQLSNRKKVLENQLANGVEFMKNPKSFLNKRMRLRTKNNK